MPGCGRIRAVGSWGERPTSNAAPWQSMDNTGCVCLNNFSSDHADPGARADRFVESWRGLARERAGGDQARVEKATTRMGVMAEGLRRDPELAKALERRAPELELKLERGRSIERSLEQSIGIGRERDRGMSR